MHVEDRLLALVPNVPEAIVRTWREVARRGSWNDTEQKLLVDEMVSGDWKKHPAATVRKVAADYLDLWVDAAATGEAIMSAYDCYYEVFFAEEEQRIRPALEAGLARAQKLARATTRLDLLLEEGEMVEDIIADMNHYHIP